MIFTLLFSWHGNAPHAWAQAGGGDLPAGQAGGARGVSITATSNTPGITVTGPITEGYGEGVSAFLLQFTPPNPGDEPPAHADVSVEFTPTDGWEIEVPDAANRPLNVQLVPGNASASTSWQAVRMLDGRAEDTSEGTLVVIWPTIEIMALDTVETAPSLICADDETGFIAVITPNVNGSYRWTKNSNNLDILGDALLQAALVKADETPSAAANSEQIQVHFRPAGSDLEYMAEHSLTVVKFTLFATPQEVYASSEADMPIAIAAQPAGVVDESLIKEIVLTLNVEDDAYELEIRTDKDLLQGNHVDATQHGGDHFTVLVQNQEYKRAFVDTGLSDLASYLLKITLLEGTQETSQTLNHALTVFADESVFCVPIGKNLEFRWSDFSRACFAGGERGWQLLQDEGESGPLVVSGEQPPDFNFIGLGAGNHGLSYSILSTMSTNFRRPEEDTLYRAGVWHAQRGFYFVAYYGLKEVEGRTVVDITKTGGSYSIDAWSGDTRIDAHVKCIDLQPVTLPELTSAMAGVLWTARSGNTPRFFASLHNYLGKMARVWALEDDARVYSDNYLIRNDEDGTPIMGLDRRSIMGLNGWSESGGGEAGRSTSYTPQEGEGGLFRFVDKPADAMQTVYGYNSSTITVTSWVRSGLFKGGPDVRAMMKLDVADDLMEIRWHQQ